MAKKIGNRISGKEAVNPNRNHESLHDEITLRDEIFELKRQMMILKRTNEQYLVKLRKYEDETKRKDKQVEQLMDPRKNAEVTKVLSTKGAAILLNLKDQNNALIQMIVSKDLQIRKLVAEIKMSKLYATTKKNESYRAEISGLRNLLKKSQKMMKENVDVQQHRKQDSSVYENSILEFSSSDQSSPRDLDELRVIILSLESHIQQSNDLLAKKNQEISSLTKELNFLRKCFFYKTYKNKAFDYHGGECSNLKFSTADFTYDLSKQSTKISIKKVLEQSQEDEKLPYFATASSKWFSSIDSPPKRSFQSPGGEQKNEYRIAATVESPPVLKRSQVSILGKSTSSNLKNELLRGEILSNPRTTICTKEKWMKALNKYRELKKVKQEVLTYDDQGKGGCKKIETEMVNKTQFLSGNSVLKITNITQKKPDDIHEELDLPQSFNKDLNENITSKTPANVNSDTITYNETAKTCQNYESTSIVHKEEYLDADSFWEINEENSQVEVENKGPGRSSGIGCVSFSQKTEINNTNSLREIYHQRLDSSLDSERNYSLKQEPRQLEVEVQIDSVSFQNDRDQFENSISEYNLIFEYGKENGGNRAPDLDSNDDDDVIVHEK